MQKAKTQSERAHKKTDEHRIIKSTGFLKIVSLNILKAHKR